MFTCHNILRCDTPSNFNQYTAVVCNPNRERERFWCKNFIGHFIKYTVFTKKITTSNLHQIQKGRSVLKSACPEDFKTDLTFGIWSSRT